jgi:hypothetical protein
VTKINDARIRRNKRVAGSNNNRGMGQAEDLFYEGLDQRIQAGVERALLQLATTSPNTSPTTSKIAPPYPNLPVPTNSSPHGAFKFDNPYWWAVPQPPKRRPGMNISLDVLRQLANSYDVLRSCINHLKREVSRVPISVVPKDLEDNSETTRKTAKEALEFFTVRGGLGGIKTRRSAFEFQFIEDLCVIGAAAIHFTNRNNGKPYLIEAIDGATIRPVVDTFGHMSINENAKVYEQWIMGIRVAEFDREELIFDGIYPSTVHPFFESPVYWLAHVIDSALMADMWNHDWLSDGTTVADMIALPENWNIEQIREWSVWWNLMLQGNLKKRQQTKWVPAGSQKVSSNTRKDQEFGEFEKWLMFRTCSLMGVDPSSIGYGTLQFKSAQDSAKRHTSDFGVGVLLSWRTELYNEILERLGYEDFQCVDVNSVEEAKTDRAERNAKLVLAGIKTINESRADEGLPRVGDYGDAHLVPYSMRTLKNVVEVGELLPGSDPATMPQGAPRATGKPSNKLANPTKSSKSTPEPRGQDDRTGASTTKRLEDEFNRYQNKCINRLKRGQNPLCDFNSDILSSQDNAYIQWYLPGASSPEMLKRIFEISRARTVRYYTAQEGKDTLGEVFNRRRRDTDIWNSLMSRGEVKEAQEEQDDPGERLKTLIKSEALVLLGSMLSRLQQGIITPDSFGDLFSMNLQDWHARAAYYGRRKAGDRTPFGDNDTHFGRLVMVQEKDFLDQFVTDIYSGTYGALGSSNYKAEEVARRAKMYVSRLIGTAYEAWRLTADPSTEVEWVVNPDAKHCERCLEIAAGSPYTLETLPTVPRIGHTPCLSNCDCELQTKEGLVFGMTGF